MSNDKPTTVKGKFRISGEAAEKNFKYCFYANNGQLLYESKEFASLASCKTAMQSFSQNVAAFDYKIDEDKNGHFKFIFKKVNVMYVGESYATKVQAEKSAESVKKFAGISELVEEKVEAAPAPKADAKAKIAAKAAAPAKKTADKKATDKKPAAKK